MTVTNATGPDARRVQARALLSRRKQSEEIEELRAEVAQLRAAEDGNLPATTAKGRKPLRKRRETYIYKRLKKLLPRGGPRQALQAAFQDGVSSSDMRAMLVACYELCAAKMEPRDDRPAEMEPRFALGTMVKVCSELIKLAQVEAMEMAGVPGNISITVHNHAAEPEPVTIDVTQGGE